MTVTVRDDRLARSLMFLCMGAAFVLLGIQWRAWATGPQSALDLSKSVFARDKVLSNQRTNAANASLKAKALAKNGVRLVVALNDRRVYVYHDQQLVTSYPVAIGQAGWETPSGSFQVLEMQEDPKWQHPITGEVILPGAENPLGKRWIGFLYTGQTHIGFHGTNQESLIGQAVSHGCIRMRNEDVMALYDQVAPGTTVDVRP